MGDKSEVVVTATFSDGTPDVSVSAEYLKTTILNDSDKLDEINARLTSFEDVNEFTRRVTIESPTGEPFLLVARSTSGNARPFGDGETTISPGDYIMARVPLRDAETGEILKDAGDYSESPLISEDEKAITGTGIESLYIEIKADNESGETELITSGYVFRYAKTGAFITIREVAFSLTLIAAIVYAAEKMGIAVQDTEIIDDGMIVRTGKIFTEAMRGKHKKNDIWPVGDAFVAEIGAIQITATDEKALDTAIGSSKTMIYLNAIATAADYRYEPDKVCRVQASMPDLLEKRRLKDTRKNRAKIRREINALAVTSWTVKDAKTGEFVTIPLAGGKCWAKGDGIFFTFSPDFMGIVLNRDAGRMATNPAILGTDDVKNPHAITIGWKLHTHSYQNIGKKNETTLSVSKLLDYVEGIPSYETVKKTDRAYTRRIIEPMEQNLNHLVEIGFLEYWDYCHKNGEPLTDEEQSRRLNDKGKDCPLPYEIAIRANIQWAETERYEEQRKKTAEIRERKRLEAEAAKQRNAERKKRIDRKTESYIAKQQAKKEMEKG